MGFFTEIFQKIAIIDVEAQIARCGVKIGAIDKQSGALGRKELHGSGLLEAGGMKVRAPANRRDGERWTDV